ncbi:MAG: phycocyanobilin:ferredoxin oxidoreductase [Nodosilinea sp.]
MQSSLRRLQHPLIRQLADCIEGVWQTTLELSPYQIPADLGYIEGCMEEGRVVIENCCYQTPQFRKLHLELAQFGNGVDILHCVMFPNPDYNLPIFGTDLVGRCSTGINAAIVDLSPVRADGTLPEAYQASIGKLEALTFSQPRDLPEWGDIFSEFCLFVRLANSVEENKYLQRVEDFLTLHCQIARNSKPLIKSSDILNIIKGQRNYCTKQQQNDKTRRILEKTFGTEWTDRYMTTMLFDTNTLYPPRNIVESK